MVESVDTADLAKEKVIPYTNCKIFGPYTRKDGRQIVIIQGASKEKTTLKIEPFIRNSKSVARDIGEALTDNADGNTEGTLEKVSAVETRYLAT